MRSGHSLYITTKIKLKVGITRIKYVKIQEHSIQKTSKPGSAMLSGFARLSLSRLSMFVKGEVGESVRVEFVVVVSLIVVVLAEVFE